MEIVVLSWLKTTTKKCLLYGVQTTDLHCDIWALNIVTLRETSVLNCLDFSILDLKSDRFILKFSKPRSKFSRFANGF